MQVIQKLHSIFPWTNAITASKPNNVQCNEAKILDEILPRASSAAAAVGNLFFVSHSILKGLSRLTHLQSEGAQPVQGHSMHGVKVVVPSAFRLTFIDRSKFVWVYTVKIGFLF